MSWNLENFWPLNEASNGSGPVARVDLVGGVELTDVNTVASGEGPNGNTPGAAELIKANSEQLQASDSTLFDFEDSGESWAFLLHVRIAAENPTQLFFSKAGPAGAQFLFHAGVPWQNVTWNLRGQSVTLTNALAVATWHKIMCWYDHVENEQGIWVDGTEITKAAFPSFTTRGSKFTIGAIDGSSLNLLDGRIANLGYRSTVWTADEKTEFNSKFMTAEDFGIGAATTNVRTLSNRRMAPIIAG